ncbi:MAG: GMC family oxidoreductase [Bacteroidota bacterium]
MPQNTQTTPSERSFDAIVIGSGISGGWAAKELCEKGLKTLILERGRDVKHKKDYPTALKNPWDFPHRNRISHAVKEENPVVSKCYAFREATEHFFVKDQEHPYIQEKPFDWIRGYQVGGKSLLWARQTQRWSRFDFEGPARDGYAVDWPIRYGDIAPWYSHVEKFVGIAGNPDGLETLPDSEFLPAWQMNVVEKEMQGQIMEAFPDRNVIIGRCAHLTKPKKVHLEQGRGQCQARSLCERGCPYGGYFSSNSSTIPWAEKTGNLTLRPDSVVTAIIYDEKQEKAIGVQVTDRLTKEKIEFYARIIFVNAACVNTNILLLNSKSNRFPNGLGNDNGLLGKYVAFHNYRGSLTAKRKGHEDTYYYGRRPTAIMMPNFRNVYKQETDFKRGYMTFYTATRTSWGRKPEGPGIGAEFKKEMSQPGYWSIYMMMQGETIPKEENHIRLSPDKVDDWGVPLMIASVGYDENDEKLLQDFLEQGEAMLQAAGCYDIVRDDNGWNPGLDIHVMGGVRMGKDPETSMLNGWSQFHNCKNVFVTDGAAMTSTGVQNPSLTFMALTARAADYAAEQFKKDEL